MDLINRFTADPYATYMGSKIIKDMVTKKITEYLHDEAIINYEYMSPGMANIGFIIGFNSDEKAMPVFDHPIIVDGLRNKYVISDLRKYTSSLQHDMQPRNIRDVTRDSSAIDFIVYRNLVTADLVSGNYGHISQVIKNASLLFGYYIKTLLTTYLALDIREQFLVEVACTYYYNMLSFNSDNHDVKTMVVDRLMSSKFTGLPNARELNEIVKNFPLDVSKGIYSLVDILKMVLNDENKSSKITVESIIELTGNSWYGPGSNNLVYIAIENIPSWLALVYAFVNGNGSMSLYKRSRIITIMEKYSNKVEVGRLKTIMQEFMSKCKIE